MGLPSFHSGYPAFLQKNGGLFFLTPPTILNGVLSLKTQNFDVKSNSEKRFTFIQKNSEYAVNKQKKIIKNGKNFSLIG